MFVWSEVREATLKEKEPLHASSREFPWQRVCTLIGIGVIVLFSFDYVRGVLFSLPWSNQMTVKERGGGIM